MCIHCLNVKFCILKNSVLSLVTSYYIIVNVISVSASNCILFGNRFLPNNLQFFSNCNAYDDIRNNSVYFLGVIFHIYIQWTPAYKILDLPDELYVKSSAAS